MSDETATMTFSELGLDSVGALKFTNMLKDKLKVSLPLDVFYDKNTNIANIAQVLAR